GWCLDDLPRLRMVVKLRDAERQAMRVRIVFAVVRDTPGPQLQRPRPQWKIAVETRADIPERTRSAERRNVGPDDLLPAPASNGLPDSRQIRLSIGRPRRGGIEPHLSVRRSCSSSRGVQAPLRRKRW